MLAVIEHETEGEPRSSDSILGCHLSNWVITVIRTRVGIGNFILAAVITVCGKQRSNFTNNSSNSQLLSQHSAHASQIVRGVLKVI